MSVLISLIIGVFVLFILGLWLLIALADELRMLIRQSLLDIVEIRAAALKVEKDQ